MEGGGFAETETQPATESRQQGDRYGNISIADTANTSASQYNVTPQQQILKPSPPSAPPAADPVPGVSGPVQQDFGSEEEAVSCFLYTLRSEVTELRC